VPGPAAFEAIADRIDYPMLVVTTAAGGELSGCLVGFSTQCSINPPRYLICLSNKNHTYRVAVGATHLCAHLLADDQTELAELFGEQTGDDVDKFTRCEWEAGLGGVPILADAGAWFVGPIVEQWDAGDHRCFVIDVEAGHHGGADRFLSFQAVKNLEPGHEA
jgi:flavin reductase (DIM6/NTAB) family NADH-FMN oxidoreductase RutF